MPDEKSFHRMDPQDAVDDVTDLLDNPLLPHLQHLLSEVIDAVRPSAGSSDSESELTRIKKLGALQTTVETTLTDQIRFCRELLGYSWTDVAEKLGVSRQAARQRYADIVAEEAPGMVAL